MSLYAIGINHRTAPVAVREKVAFDPATLGSALASLQALPDVSEAVIVSTCNRTEVYVELVEGAVDGGDAVTKWLLSAQQAGEAAADCLYAYDGQSAARHVFCVACGMDSMVLGEPQILGQLKDAYRAAHDAGAIGPTLHRLFQHAFSVAKRVRTDTSIGSSAVSVAYAAVSLARRIFAGFERHTALLIGAGETIELTARHLHAQGLGKMIVANRSVERARGLATAFRGFAISLPEMPAHLDEADLVLTSTASPSALITRDMVAAAIDKRRRRPMFIVDLAVPRDVEAEVAQFEDVYLYTVDDLQGVIEANQRARKDAARAADEIIDTEAQLFDTRIASLDAVPFIRGIRGDAERIRDATVDEARRMLAAGRPADEVLNFLAETLTKRLIHTPSARLRAAGEEQNAALMEAAAELFGTAPRS